MILLSAAVAAALSAGSTLAVPTAVSLELESFDDCVDEAAIRAELQGTDRRAISAVVRVAQTSPGRIRVDVAFRTPDRSTERSFDVRRRDCGLIPRLVGSVWRRFIADLPAPTLPVVARGLPAPRWPDRGWGWSELAYSPGLAGESRFGARVGGLWGAAGRIAWSLELGYDLIADLGLDSGRADLHSGWIGIGGGWETRLADLPLLTTLIAAGGVAVGQGRGFAEDRTSVLPVGRLRAAARIGWPGIEEGWRPHLGLIVEGSAFDLRLTGSAGGTYREPVLRAEVAFGLSWATTSWPASSD